jgi:predicted transcriptional regulator
MINEALTSSDEKAIGVIARKEAQKLWDDKWEKKILDIIKKELKDVYKGKDFKDAVLKIHKKAQLAYLRLQWEKGRQFTRYDVSAS